jgi:tetratricopeptide (TPR) repeat protein
MIRAVILTFGLTCAGAPIVSAQALNDVRKLYDSGQFQQVVDMAGSAEEPRVIYVLAQSQQKLRRTDEARRVYERLAERPESDPWRGVGKSAVAILSSNAGAAVEAANEAVERDDSLAEAHYQRGLALSARQDMDGASASFQKATELDPNWAYAHYYAGLAYSKVKRIDLTASHFQTFLKLAPQAPERGEVQSILRTLSR